MNDISKNDNSAGVSAYYDADYFEWQKDIGLFGGWANAHKFRASVSKEDTVVDFGCGGGFLLAHLECKRRIGIEPNPIAAESINKLDILHFLSPVDALKELGEGFADVVVSDNALEHTLNPLQELKALRALLKVGGIIHLVVPCESISYGYNSNDRNHHLFSWSPQSLGNLLIEGGFILEYSRPYIHKWPPFYSKLAILGWPIFNVLCQLYGRVERSWFQVEARAQKPSA